jgi:hypothetical protein
VPLAEHRRFLGGRCNERDDDDRDDQALVFLAAHEARH